MYQKKVEEGHTTLATSWIRDKVIEKREMKTNNLQ